MWISVKLCCVRKYTISQRKKRKRAIKLCYSRARAIVFDQKSVNRSDKYDTRSDIGLREDFIQKLDQYNEER